ncbi:MAG: DNA polymerase III subunit gamma and tau [Nocardioidaceae bacterium]
MTAPLALYRRYRPDTFADVIGQEHVTAPLSHALENNRVHHAYLFSGPRGCGKTTSARIMARALNCAEGPTPTPCGECESCKELASNGPGSIDVIEIDAASHNGVDDARDLRERAFFSPVKSRYKVYIIDEAHMVTSQAFNALLKLVEEPPEHLRFIFATTEPEKVLGTIKSRTHHYPFRLVPPRTLGAYVVDLCGREEVQIEQTVVPLVVRAGGGSVRDSLSVLDQLIGGSGPDGVTYPLATALLGYTPDSLLDETVDALAADDGATLFGVIDKVIDTGQDPRRFAEDLLHRLRDLVVVSAVPDAASRGLLQVSEDQAERLTGQATRFGRAELTRAADVVSQGLTDMRGATAPRLLLEMMCARILLPGIDQSAEGLGARVDRVERRMSVVGDAPAPTEQPAAAPVHPAAPHPEQPPAAPVRTSVPQPESEQPAPDPPVQESQPIPDAEPPADTDAATEAVSPSPPAGAGGMSLTDVRQLWPGVLERVKGLRRYAWVLLSQNAHVKDVSDGVLTIGLVNAGARDSFTRSGADEIVRQAMIDELGVDWRVEAIIDSPPDGGGGRTSRQPESAPGRGGRPADAGGAATDPPPAPDDGGEGPGAAPADPTEAPDASTGVVAAKEAIRPTRTGTEPADSEPPADHSADVCDDDAVIDDASVDSHDLVARELGAEVIEDIRHDG